jgi:hypothetical protein
MGLLAAGVELAAERVGLLSKLTGRSSTICTARPRARAASGPRVAETPIRPAVSPTVRASPALLPPASDRAFGLVEFAVGLAVNAAEARAEIAGDAVGVCQEI